jgi:hypothetical protein
VQREPISGAARRSRVRRAPNGAGPLTGLGPRD